MKQNPTSPIQCKTTTRRFLIAIALALGCFALSRTVLAVSPPPDGGYPSNNTAEGEDSLFGLTTGIRNTAIGFNALYSNIIGSDNTAIGASALYNNTITSGHTAIGDYATFFKYNRRQQYSYRRGCAY